jgi:hypothetical protein
MKLRLAALQLVLLLITCALLRVQASVNTVRNILAITIEAIHIVLKAELKLLFFLF